MPVELLTAINILMTTYKKVKELTEKADNIELKNHILEMNEQLLDMRELAIGLREENINLKNEINKLTAISERKMTLRDGGYYDEKGEGPYCPDCYNNNKVLVTLSTGYPMDNLLVCNKCRRTVEK